MFEKGLGYSSINSARSALSSLGIKWENISVGNHPLVVRFLRGIYNLRPVKPKYKEIWDVNKVLIYLRTLSPVSELTLKDLTLKLVMLMGLTNATRVQTLHLLTVKGIQKMKSEFIIYVDGLLKQSRPCFNIDCLKFSSFPPDRRLCIYFVLKEYLKRTRLLREDSEPKLLISYSKPHNAVSKDTVSRWIKTVMVRSGINIKVYGPHSIRAASVSKAYKSGVPVQQILKTAGWSNAGTFRKFYNKSVETQEKFSHAVLKQ